MGFPGSVAGRVHLQCRRCWFNSWIGKTPWRRDRLPTPVFGLPGDSDGIESAGFDPWVSKVPWRRAWQPTLVFLPGESPRTGEPGGLQSMG